MKSEKQQYSWSCVSANLQFSLNFSQHDVVPAAMFKDLLVRIRDRHKEQSIKGRKIGSWLNIRAGFSNETDEIVKLFCYRMSG